MSIESISQPKIRQNTGAAARFWDAFGLLLCVVLALAATLFPARNSDLFFHLAAGRQLLEGTYNFQIDPFLYTADQPLVNHSWLYAAILYSIHQLPAGPEILVVIKAILAALTICLIASCSKAKAGTMTLGVFTLGLAAIGIGGRWLLQPFVVSSFLLALTLFLIERILRNETTKSLPFWSWFVLPGICLFWVNLDAWFFLGPLLITVVLGNRSIPLALACWVACLANPWGWNAFQLPLNLCGFQEAYAPYKELFKAWFAPFGAYYLQTSIGGSLTGLAFLPIALIGLALVLINPGYFANRKTWVFIFFLAMGLYTTRTLPFFCIVGAWYVLTTFKPVEMTKEIDGNRLILPKLGLVIFLILAIGGGLTGWIHSRPREERMLGLGIIPDPSLKEMAVWVDKQKKSGNWTKDREVFHLSVDFSNYLAWFAPGTKGFIDHRLKLSKKASSDYLTCHDALVPRLLNSENAKLDSSDWKEIFERWKVSYLLLQVARTEEMDALLGLLTQNRELWDVIRVDGTCTALHLLGKSSGDVPKAEDPKELAFGKGAQKIADSTWDPNANISWIKALLPESARSGPKVNEGHLRQMQFESIALMAPRHWFLAQIGSMCLNSALPQCATNPATWNAFLGTGTGFSPNSPGELLQRIWNQSSDMADPAYLWLSVRALRESLLENPNDARAWLRLGSAYGLMNQKTVERSHFHLGTPMYQIRRFQAIHCLSKAAVLAQDDNVLQTASQLLAQTYGEQFMDRTLHHMREYRRIIGKTAPINFSKQYEESLKRIDGNLAMLEKEVNQRLDRYENQSKRIETARQGASALEKAQVALQMGLLSTAFEQIESAEAREQANLDGSGRVARDTDLFRIEILLHLGMADNASLLVNEDMKTRFGINPSLMISNYNWYQTLVAASQGKYTIADGYLGDSIQQLSREQQGISRTMAEFSLFKSQKEVKNIPQSIDMVGINFGRHMLNQAQTASGLGPWVASFFYFAPTESRLTGVDLDEAMNIHFVGLKAKNSLGEFTSCRAFLKLEAGYTAEARDLWEKAIRESPEMGSQKVVEEFLAKVR